MVRVSDILNILEEMASQIGVTLVREKQPNLIPTYPYATFTILSDTPVKAYQRFSESSSGISEGMTTKTTTEKSRTVLSLTIHDENDIVQLADKCAKSMQWFGCSSGIAFCYNNGYVVNHNGNVQDRSVFIENLYWENKWGYDLNFDTANRTSEDLARINKITLKQQSGSEELSDIIIEP